MTLIDIDAIPESATTISTDGRLFVAWSEIVKAPVIEAEPVKHGRWDADCCCTVCGEEAIYYWERSCHEYTKRCPNCGAKMDLEVNDGFN